MRTQGQQNHKNPKRKSKLREYTSEFILDGANQFVFTFPIFMLPLVMAFYGNYMPLIVYVALMVLFFFTFFIIYSIKNGFLLWHKQPKTSWAFRPLPQKTHTQNLSHFLKNYGFGSTSVFLTIVVFFVYALTPYLGEGPPITRGFWFAFILIIGWDVGIYTFSILAGMERQFNAWKRENVTRNMTSAQYADFQREEYLAERGRAAGFNEGYMVGRNSRH